MDTKSITLSFGSLVILGITSGFFVGLFSAIVNLIIAHNNQKAERNIETAKYQNSINDYRYKELHKYLKNVCDIISKEGATITQSEYQAVMSIYLRALPLFDEDIKNSLLNVDTAETNNAFIDDFIKKLQKRL